MIDWREKSPMLRSSIKTKQLFRYVLRIYKNWN